MSEKQYSGYVAIVGRPNVGKSTLLNHLLETKISITSRKPQTTRQNVLGIKTVGPYQLIMVDTPGIHGGQSRALNNFMNKTAHAATKECDVVVFMVDKDAWVDDDEKVLQQIKNAKCPIIVAVNKVDQLSDKTRLLPHLQALSEKLPSADFIPISALKNDNLDALEKLILKFIPEGDHFYPEDQITDRSMRFLASELIREKITRQMGDEVPHQIAVEIERYEIDNSLIHIDALILVEKEGQKRMVIGDKGSRLKSIGQQARADIEALAQSKVMLKLWVKVKSGWSDDARALRSLGYDD